MFAGKTGHVSCFAVCVASNLSPPQRVLREEEMDMGVRGRRGSGDAQKGPRKALSFPFPVFPAYVLCSLSPVSELPAYTVRAERKRPLWKRETLCQLVTTSFLPHKET